MDYDAGGLKQLLDTIDTHDSRCREQVDDLAHKRDALGRARHAILGILPIIAPAQARPPAPVTPTLWPPTPPDPATPPLTPPAPPAALATPAPATPAPVVLRQRQPRPRSPKPKRPALKPTTIKVAAPAKPEEQAPNLPTITASVLEVAREHPGHRIDVLARMVADYRKTPGKMVEKRTRERIKDMVAKGRLHQNPDGALSAEA